MKKELLTVDYNNNKLVGVTVLIGNREVQFIPRNRHMMILEKQKANVLRLRTEIAELKEENHSLRFELETKENR